MCSPSSFPIAGLAVAGALTLALGSSGCDRRTNGDSAALGSPSPVPSPVGPPPGPKLDAGTPVNPYADDAFARNAGRVYFNRYNCSGCHGDHGGGGMGPSLRDGEWLWGSSDGEIFRSIAEGRGHGMPAWGTKIPDDIVWKLVAYVTSFRTPEEPDAPDQSVPAPPPP